MTDASPFRIYRLTPNPCVPEHEHDTPSYVAEQRGCTAQDALERLHASGDSDLVPVGATFLVVNAAGGSPFLLELKAPQVRAIETTVSR